MPSSELNYLPLAPLFFSLLAGAFVVLVAVIEIRALRYAYLRLGISSGTAMLLLFGSLLGSYINIPVGQLPAHRVLSGEEVPFFGMRYMIPVVVAWPGTVIAVNLGGAVIPGLLSLYLIVKNGLWLRGLVATACVTAVCHRLAYPVPGLGIAVPVFVPPLAAAVVGFVLSRRAASPLAYIGGSLGTLIGADLLNLDKLQGLGAPVASIGGAGTFDGIFLSGVLAVLFASLVGPQTRRADRRMRRT